jgi:predicted metallopeptidase
MCVCARFCDRFVRTHRQLVQELETSMKEVTDTLRAFVTCVSVRRMCKLYRRTVRAKHRTARVVRVAGAFCTRLHA